MMENEVVKKMKVSEFIEFVRNELSYLEIGEVIQELVKIFNEKAKKTVTVEFSKSTVKAIPKLVVEFEFEKIKYL